MAKATYCDHCKDPDPRFWVTDAVEGTVLALCPGGVIMFAEVIARAMEAAASAEDAPELADDTDRATLPERPPGGTVEPDADTTTIPDDEWEFAEPEDGGDAPPRPKTRAKTNGRKSTALPEETQASDV